LAINVLGKVTRLGENSPNVWLFALGSLMKITAVVQIWGQLFATGKVKH
jgi:hypothetical protein